MATFFIIYAELSWAEHELRFTTPRFDFRSGQSGAIARKSACVMNHGYVYVGVLNRREKPGRPGFSLRKMQTFISSVLLRKKERKKEGRKVEHEGEKKKKSIWQLAFVGINQF